VPRFGQQAREVFGGDISPEQMTPTRYGVSREIARTVS
jgi:hypothetical protein